MKILYFISALGHGSGGHFHSLNHISRGMGIENNVKIVSIGPGFSPIISHNPFFDKHIYFKGFDFYSVCKKIKELIKIYQPDILHCFDDRCYNFIRLFCNPSKYKIIVNKCGGPNPKNYPFVNNLILFSQENFDWFEKNKKYAITQKKLIPNRVQALSVDNKFHPIEKRENFTFVIICRIGESYKKSIEDSINLIEILKKKNIHSLLYVIGVIEDDIIFEDFKNDKLVENKNVIFLTREEYTIEASKMLYLADAVIGTGRGFMEASSLAKPMLAINSKENVPYLITSDNFMDAFKTNFSERNVFDSVSSVKNIENICEMIKNKNSYNKLSEFSKKIFENYFDINKASKKYINFYKDCRYSSNKIVKDSWIVFNCLRGYYHAHKKSKRF